MLIGFGRLTREPIDQKVLGSLPGSAVGFSLVKDYSRLLNKMTVRALCVWSVSGGGRGDLRIVLMTILPG
jgi:hypothetical protein